MTYFYQNYAFFSTDTTPPQKFPLCTPYDQLKPAQRLVETGQT
jgi:hypothetical protein